MEKEPKELTDIDVLLFKSPAAVRIVNLITLYRIITFPLLILFAATRNMEVFKWLLLASFFTDAIDGFLARKYRATSILGSKLDSIGDDLTILAAVVGLFVIKFDFIRGQVVTLGVLLLLFFIQLGLALYRYKKISTFHTYLAKIAAVVTAVFLLSVFFTQDIYYPLFYAAVAITGIELIEEIILVILLKDYQSNVKGLYWIITRRKHNSS